MAFDPRERRAILVIELAAVRGEPVNRRLFEVIGGRLHEFRLPAAAVPAGRAERDRAAKIRLKAARRQIEGRARNAERLRLRPQRLQPGLESRIGVMRRECRGRRLQRLRTTAREKISSHRHDEQPWETQQHFAVVTRLVGADDLLRIGGEKFLALLDTERRQERLQRRALEPFGDRRRRRHDMVIDDVPDIDMRRDRLEQIVILLGDGRSLARRRFDLRMIPPWPAFADFALETSAGSRVLSGIWIASTPPCGMPSISRRMIAGCSGSHCITALPKMRSVRGSGCQVGDIGLR